MKKNLLILLMFTFTGVLFAQTKVESEKKTIKVEKVELKTVDKPNTGSNGIGKKSDSQTEPIIIQRLEYKAEEKDSTIKEEPITLDQEKIANLDSYINAVDHKVAFIKADPEKDKKAKESGWYEDMEKNRSEAVAEREELLKTKK